MPATPFFSAIPFGMTSYEQDAWLRFGGGNELWIEFYAPFNLISVLGGNFGTQMLGWFTKEINSLADLLVLNMRYMKELLHPQIMCCVKMGFS